MCTAVSVLSPFYNLSVVRLHINYEMGTQSVFAPIVFCACFLDVDVFAMASQFSRYQISNKTKFI